MIRNLIFDWSGTLADDLPSVLCAVNGMLRAAGRAELTRAEFQARFRLPYPEFFRGDPARHAAGAPATALPGAFPARA
jgi:phosphoglycolate phosphatase